MDSAFEDLSAGPDLVKILLVDDILENLLALEALLKLPNVQVFCATTATQALELMLENDFALALIDVQMPEINGFELARMIHSTERTRHTPVVLVTAGTVQKSSSVKGYESGAIDFLYKPLDNDIVRSKVKVFGELYRQRRELKRQVEAMRQAQEAQKALLEKLQSAQDDLQQAMRLRDDFMSIVSHELRTPLNTLKLELYTRRVHLERGDMQAFSPERLGTMLDNDDRQLNQLVRLISDMTDVSRIRTGQLSMRPTETDLVALAQRLVAQFSRQLEMALSRATVHATEAVLATVDEFRLEQALTNLLTNAIRYCAEKPIDIYIERDFENGTPRASITVRDYGKGIDPVDRERIFEQFERGANERKGSGLGLGLFIANQIVLAHGGTLSADSSPGEGAAFCIVLPCI